MNRVVLSILPVPPAVKNGEDDRRRAAGVTRTVGSASVRVHKQPSVLKDLCKINLTLHRLVNFSFRRSPQRHGIMIASPDDERVEILSDRELGRTMVRLATQVLETVDDSRRLMLLGIPTRGVQLSRVLARELERLSGHAIAQGSLDPTFHRDDLERIGTRLPQLTTLPNSVEERQVVLVDDVIFTGRTVRAALEALQSWGRAQRVMLLVMVDRGHRELPIQPDFCGRVVPTRRSESIELRLSDVDGEEGVFLRRFTPEG